MSRLFYLFLPLFALLSFTSKPKKFPEIKYTTNHGTTFTNENFKGKETIVVLFHLGCPPAMALLKDLETIEKGEDVQIIGIAENSPEQIEAFNSGSENEWSNIRKSFKLAPVGIPLIGECDDSAIDEEKKEIPIVHCRILAKKIKTSKSPTLVYVNGEGSIVKIKKGYLNRDNPIEHRTKYLLDFP